MPEDYPDNFTTTRKAYSPYEQSRSALRKRFGARSINASAPPSDRNRLMTNLGPGKDNWNAFFAPVTPETSMFGAAAPAPTRTFKDLGVSGGDKASTLAAGPAGQEQDGSNGKWVQDNGQWTWEPAQTSPALPTAPLTTAPTDYLKSAHQKATKFWAGMGKSFAPVAAGQVQAGTTFKNLPYQTSGTTGYVSSRSENRFRGLMKKANTELPSFFDVAGI